MVTQISAPVSPALESFNAHGHGQAHAQAQAATANASTLLKLDSRLLKELADCAGFQARFQSPAIASAVIEFLDGSAFATIDISKNAKPSEIAFRYTRDFWEVSDQSSWQQSNSTPADKSKIWVKTSLSTDNVPESVIARLSQLLQNPISGQTLVRVDFKAQTLEAKALAFSAQTDLPASLDAASQDIARLPLDPSTVFSTIAPEVEAQAMTALIVEAGTPAQSFQPDQQAQVSGGENWKYSTYSRSEVDRLLKQQTEQVSAQLGARISAQSKSFQEQLAEQQKTFARLVDKLEVAVDEARTKLESGSKSRETALKAEFGRFHQEISKELEQFKQQMNKSMVPAAKSIDEKLKGLETIVEEQKAVSANKSTGATPTLLYVMVVLSLVASVANLALSFGHH